MFIAERCLRRRTSRGWGKGGASCKSDGEEKKKKEHPNEREGVGELREKRAQAREEEGRVERGEREGEMHGSSERERQLVAFSRDDAPNRRAAAGSVSPVAAGRPASYLCPSLLFYVS